MTLSELRKKIKAIGFKVTTENFSFGRHATYVHIESGKRLTFSVFTDELLVRWKPLLDFTTANRDALRELQKVEDLRGLVH